MNLILKTVAAALTGTWFLIGCAETRPTLHPDSEPSDIGANIEALIEKLAITDEPAANAPIFTPSKDTPKTDRRVVAYQAAEEIRKYGKRAFPYLLKHLNDGRQSVAFRPVIPCDVADACFCIIRSQVFCLPEDYPGTFYRTGADGKQHERPYFLGPALFDHDTIESWLKERERRALEEIQVEALEWLIEQEKRIGFPEEQDRRQFLYPLERQLEEVKERLKEAQRPD